AVAAAAFPLRAPKEASVGKPIDGRLSTLLEEISEAACEKADSAEGCVVVERVKAVDEMGGASLSIDASRLISPSVVSPSVASARAVSPDFVSSALTPAIVSSEEPSGPKPRA